MKHLLFLAAFFTATLVFGGNAQTSVENQVVILENGGRDLCCRSASDFNGTLWTTCVIFNPAQMTLQQACDRAQRSARAQAAWANSLIEAGLDPYEEAIRLNQ